MLMPMRSSAAALGLALLLALAVGLAPSTRATPSEAGWSVRVRMPDLEAGQLLVEFGLPASTQGREPLSVCLFMEGAGRFVRDMRLGDAQSDAKIVADPDDGDCWNIHPSSQAVWPRAVGYRVDLKAMAAQHGEPDYAEHILATYVWNEQAVLLHPSPLPEHAAIQIELVLPPNTPLLVPWLELPAKAGSSSRFFRSDSAQHDMGSYIVFGPRLRSLGTLGLPSGGAITSGHKEATARLSLIDLPHRGSDDALRTWMQGALGAVSSFYGELMPSEVAVTLVPMGGSSEPGIYGSVLRPLRPSAVIYFGAVSDRLNLHDDWLATHELFHIGNPFIKGRLPWLIEGFTTYYQEVLRVRSGAVRREETWEDLQRMFGRYCQPQDGRSLAEDSRQMRKTHRYQRVYWGGACVALGLDMAIRVRARRASNTGVAVAAGQGAGTGTGMDLRSLDDALRKLRRDSLRKPLTEDEVLAVLDTAAGERLATRLLHETRSIPLADWLRKLGVRPRSDGAGRGGSAGSASAAKATAPTGVVLDDTAPLAAIRRALF